MTAPLYWMSPFSLSDGYGVAAIALVDALTAAGVDLDVHECWFCVRDKIPAATRRMLEASKNRPLASRIGVCLSTPGAFRRLPTPIRIGYTMYESTHPEKHFSSWYTDMESADALLVPTQSSVDIFRSHYKGPISIVPIPLVSAYQESEIRKRGKGNTFTFGIHGTLTERKCPFETVKAFQRAFPDEQDVRLEIKTKLIFGDQHAMPKFNDPRIKIISGEWSTNTLVRWLYKLDCHLFISRGEGFGIPPRESLATGCPVIVSETGGLIDLKDYCMTVPIKSKVHAVIGGEWDEPDWDALVSQMRYAYENRDEASSAAVDAAKRYREDYSWASVADKFIGAIGGVETKVNSGVLVPATQLLARTKERGLEPILERLRQILPSDARVLTSGFSSTAIGEWLAMRGFDITEVSLTVPSKEFSKAMNQKQVRSYRFVSGSVWELRALLAESERFDYAIINVAKEYRDRADILDLLNEVLARSENAILVVPGRVQSKLFVAIEQLNSVSERRGEYTIVAIDKAQSRRGIEIRNNVQAGKVVKQAKGPKARLVKRSTGYQIVRS